MYNKIIKGVLEPLKNINKACYITRNHIHISVGHRNEKILHQQGLFYNDNIIKIKNEDARRMLELISLRNQYSGRNKMNLISLFIKSEKDKYPNNVILLKNGNKYESFEEDSILFVEHCGLSFNGETPHVEFDSSELNNMIKSINEAGISVNVYNEVVKGGLLTEGHKSYYLLDIYTPYTHNEFDAATNSVLNHSDVDSKGLDVELVKSNDQHKILGLGYDEDGYTLSVLDLSGSVEIYHNLNEMSVTDIINRLDSRIIVLQDSSNKIKSVFRNLTNIVHYHYIQGSYVGENFHKSLVQEVSNRLNLNIDFKVNYLPAPNGSGGYVDYSIIKYLRGMNEKIVFNHSYDYIKRYLKGLIYKHQFNKSDKIREINRILSDFTIPLIQIKSIYNANRNMSLSNVENLMSNLNVYKIYVSSLPSRLTELVFQLVKSELNIEFNQDNLMKQCKRLDRVIESYVNKYDSDEDHSDNNHANNHVIRYLKEKSKIKNVVKMEFIANQVNRVEECYNKVLSEICTKFIDSNDSDCSKVHEHDWKHIKINNNIVYCKQLSSKVNHVNLDTIQAVENNKLINCYTNSEVNLSLMKYLNECEILNYRVEEVISKLQMEITQFKQIVEIITHYLIVSLNDHVRYAISNGWNLIDIDKDSDPKSRLPGNSNKIGNSTLLVNELNYVNDDKHILFSILLSNLGLYAPCGAKSTILEYTNYCLYNGNKQEYMNGIIEHSDKNTLMIFKSTPSEYIVDKLLKNEATVLIQDGNRAENAMRKEPVLIKEEVDKITRKISSPKLREKVKMIIKFVNRVADVKINSDLVFLAKNNVPPPRFSQLPVVYVLFMNLKYNVPVGRFNKNKIIVYVGETGDITSRLNKHKTRTNLNLNDYMKNQFVDYNNQLSGYLKHIYKISKNNGNASVSDDEMKAKYEYEIDFNNMNILLLRLKSRKECKVVENKLIQQLFDHPDLFIVLSHRDGKECNVPYVD